MEIWGEKMEYCFSKLRERVISALDNTDLEALFRTLKEISGPSVVTGVGGSSVVSAFFAKVLSEKNGIVCDHMMPRDLLSRSLAGYENGIACSYSGRNIGVTASFRNGLKKYLLSGNRLEGVTPLQYTVKDEEESFVSIAGTLIPMSILLLYYTDGDRKVLEEILDKKPVFRTVPETNVVEILYGYRQSTAAAFLDSTLVEGALAAPVLHEKYNYCHGRCQLNDAQKNDLIYFPEKNGLDDLYEQELPAFYHSVTRIDSAYGDPVVDDFYLTCISMILCRTMAERKGKDFCVKIVPEISDKLYLYKGDM